MVAPAAAAGRPAPAVLTGTPVVPGLACGPVLRVESGVSAAAVAAYGDGGHGDAAAALAAYDGAVLAVVAALTRRAELATGAAAQVLRADAALAGDPGLRAAVRKRLRAGAAVLSSISAAVGEFTELLVAAGGPMAERVVDLLDIERRLVAHLVGEPEPGVPVPTRPAVLVAAELVPSDAAGLDPDLVLGLVLEGGGPTSHTVIIARELAIPCLVGVLGATRLPTGTPVLLDATAGTVEVAPGEAHARRRMAAGVEWQAALSWAGPGRTIDGAPVQILANVADGGSAARAAGEPVEGVGLFRTELCLRGHRVQPSVEAQAALYADVLRPFRGRCVVVRTLDAGRSGETNPALGRRGLRQSAEDRGPLERQLDAVAAASAATGTEAGVMAPMVATVAEATWFAAAVRARGLRAGVMVEVPAAALLAPRFLEVVDFLSIGTNDLAQYAMAADRTDPGLVHLSDPWQPAVLRLVAMTAEAGRRAGKPVGVCGEAAADPLLACVLVGLGVTSLSMAAVAVRPVGARLATASLATCERAAAAALAAADPRASRVAVAGILDPVHTSS